MRTRTFWRESDIVNALLIDLVCMTSKRIRSESQCNCNAYEYSYVSAKLDEICDEMAWLGVRPYPLTVGGASWSDQMAPISVAVYAGSPAWYWGWQQKDQVNEMVVDYFAIECKKRVAEIVCRGYTRSAQMSADVRGEIVRFLLWDNETSFGICRGLWLSVDAYMYRYTVQQQNGNTDSPFVVHKAHSFLLNELELKLIACGVT